MHEAFQAELRLGGKLKLYYTVSPTSTKRYIYAKGQVSGASLLSMLPTGGDIFVEFGKLSDVLIMTGATSRTAQERALPDGVTASPLSLANFARFSVQTKVERIFVILPSFSFVCLYK